MSQKTASARPVAAPTLPRPGHAPKRALPGSCRAPAPTGPPTSPTPAHMRPTPAPPLCQGSTLHASGATPQPRHVPLRPSRPTSASSRSRAYSRMTYSNRKRALVSPAPSPATVCCSTKLWSTRCPSPSSTSVWSGWAPTGASADRFGGFQRTAAHEHSQPPKEALLIR